MTNTCFLTERFDADHASGWVANCASESGWTAEEAKRLGDCVADSARAVSEKAYRLRETGPVFVKLDVTDEEAMLELHHEGSLGDRPCDCAAAKAASERVSSNWTDAQLRTHKLRIGRR